ncbi:DUF6531 domain-containing protein, partial [Sulfurirhabdus autotrophica]|uniref:DUF6531 domain-containing protein n=1 Tax=Sulfurirhabdus autotrophica TaxID=1706046 RepID=UPI000F60ABB2
MAERAARALSASEQKSAGESQRMLAAGKRAELAGLRSQAREEFGKTRQRLVALGLAGKVKAWDGLLANAEQRFDRLDKALVDVDVADGNGRQRAFRHLQAELKAVRGDEAARNMGVGELPGPTFRHDVTPVARPVEPSNQLPKYLASRAPANNVYAFLGNTLLAAVPATPPEAVSCGYVKTQDLAATADAPQTTQIQKLAEQLGYSPARIFEYVSNNIQFEPYYGSLKGAMGALNTKAGGPTDQASLLIALLRASNIPARYVRGTVKITDPSPTSPAADGGRMARWVGAKSYAGAAAILAAGKFNTTLFHNSALQNNAVQFQHVWVEACVPYGRYRGAAVDNSGERWIPLDPSFKDKSYQAGIATSVSFDYPGYLAARTNGPDSLPQEAYAQQVQTIVRNANPDATVGDVPYKGTQNPLTVDILPASLPFEVVNFTNWPSTTSPEAYQLPPDHRYRFSISGLGLASPYNLYLPDVALSRVTLSFKGATQGDQTLLDAWRTDNNTSSAIPLCNTVSVVPVLRVEGQDKGISGAAVDLCSTKNALSLSVFLDEFSGTAQTVNYNNIGAANLLALQGYAFQGSDAVLAQRAAILLANVNNTPNPNATADTLDSTEGEFLNLVGLKYMRYISDAAKKVGGINGGSGESGNHMGLASSQIKVQYLFDLPFAVNRAGFLVDMPGVISRDVDLSTGSPVWATFKLAGYAGSAYEAYVWQENAHLDAVSTIRGLQYANEPVQNIGNVIINSANWSSVRPLLSVYPGATADDCSYSLATLQYPRCMIDSPNTTDTTKPVGILGLVNLGYSITLPKSLIQYGDWKGYVFASERSVANPSDTICNGVFCASYAINKLSGGATINTLISSLFSPTLNTGFYATQESPAYLQQISNPFGGTNNSTLANGPPVTAGGDPVNMASGNMYHTERDITIKGRGGLPMVFERSYNSRQPVDGPLGYGWTHSFNHSLKFYGVEGGAAKVSWIDGTGAEKFFATTGQTGGNLAVGVIPSPAGVFVTFQRKADGSYTLREKNGLTYQFETATGPSGVPGPATIPVTARLQSITDRNGNALNLSYSASCGNNLCSVTDALGHALTFTYVGSHLTQIQDFTGRQYQYGYTDGSGNLTSFKNPLSVANATTLPPVTYSYYTSVDGTSLNHLMKQYILPRRNGMKFEYYANGRTFRHTVVNTDGSLSADQINSFAYNDFRRESFQVNERGLERHFFFDPNGNPLKIVEENGAEHSYQYNQSGQPFSRTAKTDPQGLFTQYAYDASGNVTQITTPRNATVKFFDFTAYNQPRRIQDARGNWTILRYDPAGNLSDSIRTVATYTPSTCSGECAIPAAAQILSWSVNGYDNHGNLTSSKRVRDFAGQIANNTPTSTTGPIVAYTFDANQLNATTVARTGIKNTDASPSTQSAALGYDPLGRLITGIDTDWYPTSFTYDTVDRIIQATDRLGKLRDYQFDANGNPVGQKLKVDLYGTQTLVDSSAARYDDADRLQAATDAGGNVTGYSYDATGNVVSVTNPDNYSIGIGYDAANRAVLAYDQENNAVSSSRDADGKVRSITDPNGNTVSNTYWDATRDGRLKTVSSPAIQSYTSGRTLQYDYDENGNVTSLTEIPAGGSGLSNRATTSQYDELNRPTRIVGPQYTDAAFGAVCPVTVYSYDSLSRRTQVKAGYTPSPCTSAAADITKVQETLAFDDFNRKTRSTDALGKFWSIVYDANNNATSVSDAKNQITSFTWDTGHQLLSRTEQGGRKTTYQRNVLGQLIQTVHPEATTTFGYDNTHRLASVIDSRGLKNLSYSWSPGGLLNHLTDSDGRITSYLYDPVGRLAGVTAPNNDTVTYRFDAGGRLTERWLANNASARYAYNADNSLKQLVNRNTASTILSQHDYTYDGVGNRASQTENIGGSTLNYAYSYDELKRLTQVTNGTAAQQENDSYDPWNNRTLKSIGNP